MNFADLCRAVSKSAESVLKGCDFSRTNATTWVRIRGSDINIIQIQRRTSGQVFCVNLGIHYSFLPIPGTDRAWTISEMGLPECEIKLRLTDEDSKHDQWWPQSQESADSVSRLLRERSIHIFDAYRSESDLLLTLDPESIKNGDSGILSPITPVRACLLLARLHEHFNNREKCIQAAIVGLQVASPMAVGPRLELQEIIKRCRK